MPDVSDAGRRRDVLEGAVAIVLEQHVTATHGRHVQIGVAIVVDIGKGRRDADLAGNRHAG